MPAFSCQYLDKDELLHLAGANKDHIYIILILHIYIVRPFRNAALFIFHVGLDDLSVLHGRCSVPKALQAGFEPCLQYLEHFEHTYHLRSLKYP